MSNENQIETTENDNLSTENIMESETEQQQADGETTAESKQKAEAAWIAFTAACKAHAELLGLEVKEQAGFVKFTEADTGQKLYASKGAKAVKRIDTTLPLIGVLEGAYELDKPNGKIACHIPADQGVVFQALEMMAEKRFGKVRPANRPAKAEPAVESTPAE